MAITATEKFRMSAGGKTFRVYEFVHDSSTTKTITAASLEMDHITAIVGVNTKMSMDTAVGSIIIDQLYCSISANNLGLTWTSTGICTQTMALVGW